MGAALTEPTVLVLSVSDDHSANMLWLDSTYPTDHTSPGGPRGGAPAVIESQPPDSNAI